MTALRREAGRVSLHQSPIPAPAALHALVRVTRMAIASPDLAVWAGRIDFEGTLGHECAGIVESVPEPAHARWLGKRVSISPTVVCGVCDLCKSGLSTHCPRRTVMGLHAREGVFAECISVPVSNLVEIPKAVTDDDAACASTLAAALHACALVRVERKPYVTVLGDGPIALLCAQILARRNASVRVLGKHPARLALCERWGVRHRLAVEAGLRQDQDVVLDCTGSARGTNLALHFAKPRGSVVVKGWPLPAGREGEARVALAPALANELTILGAGPGNISEALAALDRREVDIATLITKRCKLKDWDKAFDAIKSREAVKILMH
jgi:alcohol dehydrogenase